MVMTTNFQSVGAPRGKRVMCKAAAKYLTYCPRKDPWKFVTNKTASLKMEVIIWWIIRNWWRFAWEGYAFCI
jgi:hypothetical protein